MAIPFPPSDPNSKQNKTIQNAFDSLPIDKYFDIKEYSNDDSLVNLHFRMKEIKYKLTEMYSTFYGNSFYSMLVNLLKMKIERLEFFPNKKDTAKTASIKDALINKKEELIGFIKDGGYRDILLLNKPNELNATVISKNLSYLNKYLSSDDYTRLIGYTAHIISTNTMPPTLVAQKGKYSTGKNLLFSYGEIIRKLDLSSLHKNLFGKLLKEVFPDMFGSDVPNLVRKLSETKKPKRYFDI